MKRFLKSSTVWFTVSAIAVLALGLWLTWKYWGWLHPDDPTNVSKSETLRNAGILIGGVLALVFAWWRAWVAERQSKAAQEQAANAQRQADIAQQTLLNERYQRGAEMLGNRVLSVRMGGIYALQRLAEEHPNEYHVQVMDLFCAFVRHPTYDGQMNLIGEGKEQPYAPRPDVSAVLEAIRNRADYRIQLERKSNFQLNLQDADLHQLSLANADLSGANLLGVNLSYSSLQRSILSNALLAGANLYNPPPERRVKNGEIDLEAIQYRVLSHVFLAEANISGTVFSLHGTFPAEGLLQTQLDLAWADPNNLPILDNVLDAETGEPLVWRGRPLEDES